MNEIDILPFIKSTYIIFFPNLTLVKNEINGRGMVIHPQPIPHILTFTIHGQRLAMDDVIDH